MDPTLRENIVAHAAIGAAIEIHRILGPGLLESVYERVLAFDLEALGYKVLTERPVAITYKTLYIQTAFRLDLLIEDCLIIEVKAVNHSIAVHKAQLLTYLRMTGCRLGLLINFNQVFLKDGIRRVVNDL